MALSHRLSCVPGGSVSWSSSIPGSRSSHFIVSSSGWVLSFPCRYLSSLSQQLQINRFFSNEARIRLGGSAWSHVQLSVREGCKLGGPRKLCSWQARSLKTVHQASQFLSGSVFVITAGSILAARCMLSLLAVVLVVSPCIVRSEFLFSFFFNCYASCFLCSSVKNFKIDNEF